jgi:hypothetical protein
MHAVAVASVEVVHVTVTALASMGQAAGGEKHFVINGYGMPYF